MLLRRVVRRGEVITVLSNLEYADIAMLIESKFRNVAKGVQKSHLGICLHYRLS